MPHNYIGVLPFSLSRFLSPKFVQYFVVPEWITALEPCPDRRDGYYQRNKSRTNHFVSDLKLVLPSPIRRLFGQYHKKRRTEIRQLLQGLNVLVLDRLGMMVCRCRQRLCCQYLETGRINIVKNIIGIINVC